MQPRDWNEMPRDAVAGLHSRIGTTDSPKLGAGTRGEGSLCEGLVAWRGEVNAFGEESRLDLISWEFV